MKFFRVLLFFFLLFIVGVTTYWISQDFVHKNRDVVILGDSHVNLIETITDSTWQQLLVDVDVIGLGFNGYTSSQLLSGEYSPLRRAIEYRPKHVIVVIGANDVGNEVDPDLTLRNIAAIHEAFSNTSSQVYFTSVPPVSREYDVAFGDGNFNKRIVELNLRIRNYCEGLDCYYFDLHDHLSTQHTNGSFYLSKDLTSDGIHLNEKGYKLWIKALRIELLKSRLK